MHALLFLLLVQDTRHVTEQVVPKSCTVLTARVSSAPEEDKPDTAQIQEALDKCPQGQAVKLSGKLFLAGPLQLRAGVTLLVDTGTTLYASRNPRDYDVSP